MNKNNRKIEYCLYSTFIPWLFYNIAGECQLIWLACYQSDYSNDKDDPLLYHLGQFKLYLFYNDYVKQLIIIMLVGSDVYVRWSSCGRKPEYPEENPPVWLGDQMAISHCDAGYWTWIPRWEASALPLHQPDSRHLGYSDHQSVFGNIDRSNAGITS